MATARALKLLLTAPVGLPSGRTDFSTILFSTSTLNGTIPYNAVICEDKFSPDYNKPLIDSYIANGILTPVTVTLPSISVQPAEHIQVATGAAMDFAVTAAGDNLHYEWLMADHNADPALEVFEVVGIDDPTISSILAIATTLRHIKVRVYNNSGTLTSSTVNVLAGS